MKLEVLKNPNKKLRQKSVKISKEQLQTKQMQDFLDNMIETMEIEKGVGLAAPQVGKNVRVLIALIENTPIVIVNPKISKKSFKKIKNEEGCLSIPGVVGIVQRNKSITINALNRQGDSIKLMLEDLESIILQHEIDHLDGILFIDRAKKLIHIDS